MEIKIADNAGTCFGVNNAIDLAFKTAKKHSRVHIMGELVHNPFVVKKLKDNGVKEIKSLDELKEGDNLIIRAHGESANVYENCKKKGVNIIDCTCPFVTKAQKLAMQLEKEGYQVVIIGAPDHPEVRGIAAQTNNAKIISEPSDVKNNKLKYGKLGILSQTTQTIENFSETVAKIVSHPKIIKIHNTICTATERRQKSAKRLAKQVELMIVIGGKNSSNTKKLYELCSDIVKSKWITDESELKENWFKNVEKTGITAGASTPKEIIDRVKNKIESFS